MHKRFSTEASLSTRRDGQAALNRLCAEWGLGMGALPPRPTIRDVAGAAGVSVGTASHALNGTGRVAASTRARVAGVADRLGYRPDPRGRALRSPRTTTLGLVLPVIPGPRRPGEF